MRTRTERDGIEAVGRGGHECVVVWVSDEGGIVSRVALVR